MIERVEFGEGARTDYLDIVGHYASIREELGQSFTVAFQDAIEHIKALPYGWEQLPGGFRKKRIAGFPYILVYRPEPSKVVVLAVFHAGRRPYFWLDRVQ